MINEQEITRLVEEKLEGTDQFLVHLEILPGNRIVVELDADSGLPISACVAVSRHVEHNLDREADDFSLEVSSAGIDRPIRTLRQYRKNIGRKVNVKTTEGQEKQGILKEISDEALKLEIETREKIEGKKRTIVDTELIPFEGIAESKLVISI